jgi:tetratricopeptide (TPR) repeat protein
MIRVKQIGIIKAFLLKITVIGIICQMDVRAGNTDSLLTLLHKARPDTNKVILYNTLAKEYIIFGNYDSALIHLSRSIDLAKKLNYTVGLANAINNTGAIEYYRANFKSALQNYQKALKLRIGIGNKKNIATSYSNIAVVHSDLGNYPEAIKYHLKALKIREALNDIDGMVASYGNLGITYSAIENFSEALSYQHKSKKLAIKINNLSGLAGAYNNILVIYHYTANYDSAKYYAYKALEQYKEIGDQYGIANVYNNLASINNETNQYDTSLKYNFMSLEIKNKLGDQAGISESLLNIGSNLYNIGKTKQALTYLNKALNVALVTGFKLNIQNCYEYLSQTESKLGDFVNALKHYKLMVVYRDSLTNEANTKKVVQQQMQYDFNKKQAADSIKNAERTKLAKQKHNQEIQQQRIYTYGGIIGFGLMLVVALVSFRAYRNKQKANKLIELQKQLVEEKQKEILDSIYYAKRIQMALLPGNKYIERKLNEMMKK